MYLSLESR